MFFVHWPDTKPDAVTYHKAFTCTMTWSIYSVNYHKALMHPSESPHAVIHHKVPMQLCITKSSCSYPSQCPCAVIHYKVRLMQSSITKSSCSHPLQSPHAVIRDKGLMQSSIKKSPCSHPLQSPHAVIRDKGLMQSSIKKSPCSHPLQKQSSFRNHTPLTLMQSPGTEQWYVVTFYKSLMKKPMTKPLHCQQ